MAVSIEWGTKVIYIPRADLTLVQASPEVRQIDINWFRMELKSIEDEEAGIVFLRTHNHNTEVSLSGLTYARIVEIINGYTVEFEDGQYTVNCVGANHNLSDVKVPNQVSLIVNNAAGLISNAAIEFASFNGGVTVDLDSVYSGTLFPIGTPQQPVNNFDDALMIASVRGFTTFYIIGDADIDDSNTYDGMIFVGESQTKSVIDIESSASVEGCEFYDAHVIGTLDGSAKLKSCVIDDLNYINGVIEQCLLESGVIALGGSEEAHLIDCWDGSTGVSIPVVDMGGSGQDLIVRNYNGAMSIRNLNGTSRISVDLNSGRIILENTITAGQIVVRGVGTVVDNTTGTAVVDVSDLINPDVITAKVWDETTADRQTPGTIGGDYYHMLQSMPRVLGLVQENYAMDQTVYDSNSNLTAARIRLYSNGASVGTDDDVMATYLVTAVFSGSQVQSYQVVKQ